MSLTRSGETTASAAVFQKRILQRLKRVGMLLLR
jgi:hypothetical protein